jgi:hypothetical protein
MRTETTILPPTRSVSEMGMAWKNRTQFPAATVAFYGPNRDLATKVVVGIISQPDNEPAELKRWRSTAIDIRRNSKAMKEVLDFIRAREVAEVALLDVIFGCPHEEGTDYPEGESCPHCLLTPTEN